MRNLHGDDDIISVDMVTGTVLEAGSVRAVRLADLSNDDLDLINNGSSAERGGVVDALGSDLFIL